MALISRRDLLRAVSRLGLCQGLALVACRERIVRVSQIVEVPKEVTKVVNKIVRETVIVEETQIVERTVERIVTASPAPRPTVSLVADVMHYGWTQFAMLVTPAFSEMFPQIRIEWRSLSDWSEYPQRIAALAASGQTGDIVESPVGTLVALWAEQGLIRSLDELVSDDGFDLTGIFGGVLAACRREGRLFALPFLGHAGDNLLLYHRRLFDSAGQGYPTADWTLDDLTKAARTLTRDPDRDRRENVFGYALQYDLPTAYPMLHLFGGQLLSADGTDCLLEEAGGLACLEWAHDRTYVDGSAPKPQDVVGGPVEMLRRGRVAMLRHSFKTLVDLVAEEEMSAQIGGIIMPRHPRSRTRASLASGIAYCITERSRVAPEALQWIKFMSSSEMGVQMFLGGYSEPGCRSTSWNDPRVLEQQPLCASVAETIDASVAERLPWNLQTDSCLAAWNSEVHKLLAGELTAAECADTIASRIAVVLAS